MNTRRIRFFALLCAASACALCAEEVTRAIPRTGSHRAFAMGGAFIAFDTGVNALYGNPAGLAEGGEAEIFIGHHWQVHKTMQYEDDYYNDSFGVTEIEYKPVQKLNYIGISLVKASADSSFWFGGAVGYGPFYNWRCTRHAASRFIYDAGEIERTLTEEDTYGLFDVIQFGFGLSAGTRGSVGVTINTPFMPRFKTERHYKWEYISGNFYEINKEHDSNSDKVSTNPFLRVGGMLHVSSRISVGVLWNQSHRYEYSEEKRIFPATVNFGVAVTPVRDLLIAVDLESRPWGKVKINDLYLSDAESGTAWRFGLEYGTRTKIRAGYAWDILPILDMDDLAVHMQSLSCGLEHRLGRVRLDLAARRRFATYQASEHRWRISEDADDYLIRDWVIQSGIAFVH